MSGFLQCEESHMYGDRRRQRKEREDREKVWEWEGGRRQERRHMAIRWLPGKLHSALEGKNTSCKYLTHVHYLHQDRVKHGSNEPDQSQERNCSSTSSTLLEKTGRTLFSFSFYPLTCCKPLGTGQRKRKNLG